MSHLWRKEAMTLWNSSTYEKKKEIGLSPMTNAPTLTEKSKKQRDNMKNATKNFDYTTISDRLRTVSWSNSSYPAGVVKPVYERSTFPLAAMHYLLCLVTRINVITKMLRSHTVFNPAPFTLTYSVCPPWRHTTSWSAILDYSQWTLSTSTM